MELPYAVKDKVIGTKNQQEFITNLKENSEPFLVINVHNYDPVDYCGLPILESPEVVKYTEPGITIIVRDRYKVTEKPITVIFEHIYSNPSIFEDMFVLINRLAKEPFVKKVAAFIDDDVYPYGISTNASKKEK